MTHFRLQDYGLSYGNGVVGPVVWEIESGGRQIERIRFGVVPEGFRETVPYRDIRGVERVVVTDYTGTDVMSFERRELPRSGILRADYERVAPSEFRRLGSANCTDRVWDNVLGLGLSAPLVYAAFLGARFARRRAGSHIAHALATLLVALAALGLAGTAAAWLGVLFVHGVTGADLAAGLLLGVWLLAGPGVAAALVAVVVGAVLSRRRPPPSPDSRPFPWRLALAAFPLAIALGALTELIRPWTAGFWA